MSNEALGHVWRYSPHDGPAFLVLIAIADVVNDQNDNRVWFSLANLGLKCRLARSTVANAVKKLEEEGWLLRVEETPGKTVIYQFQFIEGAVVWNSRPQVVRDTDRGVSATRTGGVRDTDRGSPPDGHNTNINQTNSKETGTPISVRELVALYMDNYSGEIKPNGDQVAGQIKTIISRGCSFESLVKALPIVASEARACSVNNVQFILNRLTDKPKQEQATPMPPRYVAEVRTDTIPMPESVRELFKTLGKGIE